MSIHDARYRKNRAVVLKMSKGLCERCLFLFDRVTPADECDHLIARSQGGNHDLNNLWMLCGSTNKPDTCHYEKSHREKGSKFDPNQPFKERIDPKTGWPIEGDDLKSWQDYINKRNAARTIYFD